MANEKNLIPFNKLTEKKQREMARQGGIASGKARREKATMKSILEMLLDEKSSNGKTYREMATLGLLKGAIKGNAQNYRTILETLGELKNLDEYRAEQELSKLDELLLEIKKDANK